jgi:signal transduction histidine kinase
LVLRRTHPDDAALVRQLIERVSRGSTDWDVEHRLLMPDGSTKYVRAVAHAVRAPSGQLRFFGAVVDLTASKRAEEALNRAGAELAHVSRVTTLSALTASIAHEVNQPLSGIITNAGTCLRMLDAVPPNIDGARETARRTIRDGNRASDVIGRLRALFSKREFTLEPLDLNDATREVIALSSNDLQRNRIVVQSELANGLPIVNGDRIQLQQVILNLLRNAADAMVDVHDRPRQLRIRTEPENGHRVRLTVRDAGVGLPAHSMDSLFNAFYTTKNGGMGIGLFVSRSIIERHQGRLWAEPNDGPGATFSFSIPRGPAGISDAAARLRSA